MKCEHASLMWCNDFFCYMYFVCFCIHYYLLNLLGNVYLVTCDLYVFKIDLVFCFYKINYELLFLYKWKSISWIPVDFFFFLNLFMRRPKKLPIPFIQFNLFIIILIPSLFFLHLKIRIQLSVFDDNSNRIA